MKRDVVIVYNCSNETACEVFNDIRLWLEKRNYRVDNRDSYDSRMKEVSSQTEFAISLGGDGTFLSCARLVSKHPIPIFPIHLGTFGFITEVAQNEWMEALTAWQKGQLEVENRMILEVKVIRENNVVGEFSGVNDAVVNTSRISTIVRLALMFGDVEVGSFRGDGMILSTPTGSTAYSMASGGPILVPPMPALVFTPICPFSLSWRPVVLSSQTPVTFRVEHKQRADVILTVDGQLTQTLKEGDEVRISSRSDGVRIIKSNRRGFYQVVRTKLGWAGGLNA